MTIYALDGHAPQLHEDSWVAPDANPESEFREV